MSVQSEITRLEAAKAAISQAITEKGVTVPNGTMLDAMAQLISAIEAGGGDLSIHNRKVQWGSFIPTQTFTGYYVSYDSESFGGYPSGCMYWVVSDVIQHVDERSAIMGAYMSDWYGATTGALTWGRSVSAYESSASSTSNSPTSAARLKTASGGSIGSPMSGNASSYTVMSGATSSRVKLGGSAGQFVAGLEYQYILFGGLEA